MLYDFNVLFQIESILLTAYSIRCPESFTAPAGSVFFEDYESGSPQEGFPEYGQRTSDIAPACGTYSLRNPWRVFKPNVSSPVLMPNNNLVISFILYISSPRIRKVVSATLKSGRYTLSYPRGRYVPINMTLL